MLSFYTIVILIVLFLFNAHFLGFSTLIFGTFSCFTSLEFLPGMVGQRTLLAAKTGSVDHPVFQLVESFLFVFNMYSLIYTVLCNKV